MNKTRNNKCLNRQIDLGSLHHLGLIFISDSISTSETTDFGPSLLLLLEIHFSCCYITLQDVLHVPTISKRLVYADNFEQGMLEGRTIVL
uniref:Uncharacterized protein n=1 Tax=Lactuca sativa TaxID=4236 RepID=A0A9R1VGK9_LACSA|nr:hypothetical protein LSAT_V11C500286600 [Lactuca sativa]